MSVSKIKILCRGYDWSGVVPDSEIYKANFFAPNNPNIFLEEIDLANFLVKDGLGKIRYEFDTTAQTGDGTNRLFFVASDLNLSLSNCQKTPGGGTLSEYFRLNRDTSFIKFKVSIFYDNKLIYLGIIDQDGVELPCGNTNDSDIISCRVIGFEREFVEYYSNEDLKPNGSINTWRTHDDMPEMYFTGGGPAEKPYSLSLKKLIAENMANTILTQDNIRLESSIADYEVTQTPFFYKSGDSHPLMWTKTSYERVENTSDGKETKWNWLKRLCNGMGWVIFFFFENEKFCMGIKNRSSVSLPLAALDAGKFIDYRISKDKAEMTFDHMVILDGTLIGGDSAFFGNTRFKGEQLIIMSDFIPQNYNTSFINGVSHFFSGYSFEFNNPYIHYYNEEGDNFRYSKFTASDDTTAELTTISRNKILFVDVGDAGTQAQYIDKGSRVNGRGFTINGDVTASGTWLVYKGCYANMLLKRIGGQWQSYYQYVKTNIFKNNFKKFRNTKQNKKFTGTYPEIILNPFQQFQLLNDPKNIISIYDTYSIQSMTIDLAEETTELDLFVSNN